VVVSVRPIVDILASFEVLRAREPTFPTLADRALGPRSHVETRARYYMGPGGVLSQTLGAMRAAVDGGFADRMLFVDYDLLTADPRGQLRRLYAFLDEPYFEHELQRVEPRGAFDSRHHGFIGLHDVRPQFGKLQRSAREILGGAVYEAYAGPAPWDGFTRAAPPP
jgi:sulfotransferase